MATYVGSIVNENEAKRIRLEKEMEERKNQYERLIQFLLEDNKKLQEQGFELTSENTPLSKSLTEGIEKSNKSDQTKLE